MKKGINTLEEILRKNQGENAIISISHKLYGLQKIKCKLDYILDEDRVGVRIQNGQEIFVYNNDFFTYYNIKDGICFADDIMEINIKLDSAAK